MMNGALADIGDLIYNCWLACWPRRLHDAWMLQPKSSVACFAWTVGLVVSRVSPGLPLLAPSICFFCDLSRRLSFWSLWRVMVLTALTGEFCTVHLRSVEHVFFHENTLRSDQVPSCHLPASRLYPATKKSSAYRSLTNFFQFRTKY